MSDNTCGHPSHFGCTCTCYACRRVSNSKSKKKNGKWKNLSNYYRVHLVCFNCRTGRKTQRSLQIVPVPDAFFQNVVSPYKIVAYGRMNEYLPDVQCSACREDMFVVSFDLRLPKKKAKKQWEILEDLLVNLSTYFEEVISDHNRQRKKRNDAVSIYDRRVSIYWCRRNLMSGCKRIKHPSWFPTKKSQIRDYVAEFIYL